MQCTSAYPCPPERAGLNLIAELRERYGVPVGFSDHTEGPFACLAAVALGATSLEKHFTLSRDMYGPDAALAAEPGDFAHLVDGARAIATMLASPVDKDDVAPFAEMKRVFEKSVVTRVAIPAGSILEREMLAAKKPGTGIPARDLDKVVGRRARVDIPADSVLSEDALA
jgi:N-acetylneuraminate synthase